jgi:hypothetical protein
MTYTEIIKKLIGEIQPAGAAHIDTARFENLKEMCNLVEDLVSEIDKVAYNAERHEFSMHEMGVYANNFLTKNLGIVE